MGMPAARITDMHQCPMVTPGTPPVPHVGGPISGPCAPTVLTVGLFQARVTDLCVCVGPPDTIVKGSLGVIVCGLPAARIGDQCAHGGAIVMGAPTVLIGDTASGAVSAGSTGTAAVSAGQGDQSEPLAAAAAYIAPWQQAFVYKNAAKTGAAFCERCA